MQIIQAEVNKFNCIFDYQQYLISTYNLAHEELIDADLYFKTEYGSGELRRQRSEKEKERIKL